ncbi:hypothetical protein DICSQDRAFT_139277 [Dichomitus squalens LYAD-421 SS1]|uniref:ATP synthase subunit 4 n=1 Tax=Dichomitus squalens (strain LYAD-421) TaxID=732165 RepID=R7SRV9_DICSQ|nr:uncharacterized protein DICSQDRAFT_139277 [Dichomitus squalens LYAD-421 SS1]EJF58663.1 hypothetical protein DICSQDRAFT_139277 [Dichomitus squalens LYAD-421 SS1]
MASMIVVSSLRASACRVVNEETVFAAGFFILISFIYKGHIKRIRDILYTSCAEHTQVVKDRIQSVEQMKDVVSVTEGLFALSKETAQLESEAFVQCQKVALAAEVKAVLDSWVRFKQQAKESEQAELVKSVVDSVLKSLSNEKTQMDISPPLLLRSSVRVSFHWGFPSPSLNA